MMKQFGKKLLSLLLVVVLVLQIVPATVFATEETEDLATGNAPLTDATQDIFADNASETIEEFLASAQVLFEEETLREESVKHFRLENGQYLAIAYDTPVHYLDSNGEWQDYDNTLVPLNHNGQLTGYRVQNGDSLRLFSAEANSGQLVAVQTGDYSLALTPVLPVDAELPAQPVTPLEPMGDFALEETGITSSAAASVLVTVAPAETVIEDNLMAKVQPEKLYSALEYSGLMDGVSIRYENYANAIKESIVVSAPQSEYIYSFRLQTEGLTPALQESGDILFSTTDGTVIYTIPAPYMIDANNDVSYEAAYTLTDSGSEWILTVTADTAWMNAPQRTYPILIDPTISETTDGDDDICGNFVRAGYPNSPDTTDMGVYVGNNGNNNGLSRSFFHVNNLIELPYGCRVNYASFSAYHYSQSGSAVDVEIHELTSNSVQASAGIAAWKTWANNLTWNNQPPYSDIVIDSQKLSTSTTGQYITWDITKLANKWYTDGTTNIGFALVAQNEAATNARSTLYGPRKLSYRPRMAIAYRNIRGIESAYTYQNANAGKAGTAYIGDFAMQNTLVVPLWLSPSNTMPFSVSLVYNSSLSGAYFSSYYQDVNTANYETMHVGVGWKLSLQETVISKTVDGVTYRVYTDADGTEHYFLYCSDGYYRDEDGLGLKISGSSSNYTMSDDSGNQKIFTYGYLTETKDAYGNALYYCYDDEAYSSSSSSWKPSSSTTGHKVTSVYRKNNGVSAAEQILLLGYNGNRLSTIITECNFANDSSKDKHRITLGATTAANGYVLLSGITFPDETTVEYTYDNTQNYRLRTAYDGESNKGIEFTYAPNHDVKTISEYYLSDGSKIYGSRLSCEKRNYTQAMYRYWGEDGKEGAQGANCDDLLSFKVLDQMGRTIGGYTTDSTEKQILGVGAAGYTTNTGTSKKNNRLTSSASGGQQGINLLTNSGAENGSTGWYKTASTLASTSATYKYIGAKSFYLSASSTLYQTVSLTAGKTYTFSAYVKVATAPSAGGLKLVFQNSSGTSLISGDALTYSTTGVNNGWQRLTLTYTPTTNYPSARVAVVNGSTAAYADCLQLEVEEAASTYNLIEDGSLEKTSISTSSSAYGWWSLQSPTLATDDTFFGSKCAKLSDPSCEVRIGQNVQLDLPSGATFLFSGWGKANADPDSVPEKEASTESYFGLILRLYYEDGTSDVYYFSFDAYYSDWQYTQGVIAPKEGNEGKAIDRALVVAAYDNNLNTAWFDNLSLRLEPAQTYRYDNNGNLISATQTDAGSESATYASNGIDLTAYTAANGTKYTYTYNGKHDILTASCDGITNTYTYDSSGNVTLSKLTGTGTSYYIQSSATMTSDRNHTASSTDTAGNTTSYTYDGYTGRLVSTTNAKGVTVTNTYNEESGRLRTTSQGTGTSISYAYSGGQLSKLDRTSTRNGTTQHQYYNFTYNDWGQSTKIAVGTRTLATYTYEDINTDANSGGGGGNLASMTYGNGDVVNYTYDDLDRLVETEYDDGSVTKYIYNAEGSLAELAHTSGGKTTRYVFEYDSLGRLIRSQERNSDGIVQRTEHVYDGFNRLSSQSWVIGGTSFTENYTYSDGASGDGSLTKMTTATGDTLNYTYDALKRLQKVTVKNGSTALFSTAYAYRSVNGNQSSGQVEYRNVRVGTSGTILEGKKYVYDALGNITEIRQSTSPYNPLVAYEYDSQNQLISEIYYNGSGSANTNITLAYYYTYDTAGNLLKVEEGTVNSGGTITKTTVQTYTYSNTQWRDLLTAVNGNTIIYEGQTYNESTGEVEGTATSGNPTFYRNGTDVYYDMSWANGRQLTFVECYYGSQSRSYFTYDANGIRVRKNVETPGDSPTFTYVTQNGKVVRETMTERYDPKVLDYTYDESGRPFAVTYQNGNATPVTYYYILNLQGDVIGLVNASGAVVARYSYNAWGELLSVTNASGQEITDDYHIANLNHLRYRGYYYDYETGFYYLQSRYYDPANHRFINADSYTSTDVTDAISCNMFAYCGNNPIAFIDEDGDFFTRGQIHNFVLEEICSHHPSMTWKQTYMLYGIEYRNHTYGYCDLYDIMTHEIWEVKRNGSSYSCSDAFASMQLNNYINNGTFKHQEQKGDYIKGGTKTNIETWTFHKHDPSSGGVYRITYWDAGNGIIKYDYIYIPPKRTVYAMSGAAVLIGCLFLVLAAPAVALA